MPYCPQCKMEYNEGVKTCSDCGVELVDWLPGESDTEEETKYEDWVAIAKLTSHQYTEMILEVWRNEGIPGVAHSEAGYFGETGQMGATSFQPAGSGYTLLVPRDFIAQANTEAEGVLGDTWKKALLFDIEESESE